LVMGGMIMLILGIIGEYIWRVYDNLKDFPLFIIDEKLASEQDEDADKSVLPSLGAKLR